MNSDTPSLTLGYDLSKWNALGVKEPITIDLSPKANTHILIAGLSGSGKSYLEQALVAKLVLQEKQGEFYWGDYKGEDDFSYLRECPRYFPYTHTLEALKIVHSRLMARQSGGDKSRNPITLIWDEYMAQILALLSTEKKAASDAMAKVGEILMLGRSKAVRLIIACQRPDALAFPAGSRLNYGVVVVLGSAAKSTYEMLLPDFLDDVKGRRFSRGEGVVVLQGAELHFLKVPEIRDMERVRGICKKALGASPPPSEA